MVTLVPAGITPLASESVGVLATMSPFGSEPGNEMTLLPMLNEP